MSERKEANGTTARRKREMGRGVFVQALLVMTIVLAANYLAFHVYGRWDFSRSQEFRLAMHTRQLLRQLGGPLEITVYFSPSQVGVESLIARDLRSLVKEIQFSGKPKVRVEYVDPSRDLKRAREVQARLGFGSGESVLVLEYDGRSKTVPVSELADFDFSPLASGGSPRVAAFRGEQVFASSILGLLDPTPKTIYFLQGHGEPSPDSVAGISILASHFRRLNAAIAPLDLSQTRSIPDDASLIVILGPRYDLAEPEAELLLAWWRRDGRFLILLDPDSETPRLRSLPAEAGILPMDNRVLRTVDLRVAIGIVREVTGIFLGESEITKRLTGVSAHFPEPVQSLDLAPPEGKGIQVRPLIEAAEQYWGEAAYVTDGETGVAYDDGIDVGYPVILAAAADRGGISDDRVEIQSAKMVVVGASRFALDEHIGGPDGGVANLDFLASAANWLLDRARITGVAPKVRSEFRLSLTDVQLGNIALFTIGAIPGLAALIGLIVWIRRRK